MDKSQKELEIMIQEVMNAGNDLGSQQKHDLAMGKEIIVWAMGKLVKY